MAVNKGLKSIAESTPEFSNQGLENAINDLKIGWVAKSIELDTAITDSTVLTASQKNDLKDAIDNVPHINACLLYTSPSPRDRQKSRMPSSA